MTKAHIRFATQIIQRLGEELNPTPDQSILELVKNAYDADAHECVITLEHVEGPGGSITVTDDGDGMDESSIVNGWLVIGASSKAPGQRTRLGRVRAGSKGLGRLAALRMGSAVSMETRPRSEPNLQYSISINWAEFDSARTVDAVDLPLRSAPRPEGAQDGTSLRLSNLKSRVSRGDAKRLARSLLLLADPFPSADPLRFKAKLISQEYSDLESLVKTGYFEDADFHLIANVDATGKAAAQVVDWKGATLFKAEHGEIAVRRGGSEYACPPASFDLWAFLLQKETFATRQTSLTEVKEWLSAFGGVHLYHNGLRVAPYGNPGNDWLEMNLRRVRSPEERPSTNNSVGRVSISSDSDLLIQKTDRSGFIETETFQEIREFATDALEWMAKRRMEVATKRRAQERATAPKQVVKAKESVQEAIQRAPKQSRTAIFKAFEAYDRSKEKEVDTLRKEVQLYRTLSTAGITAATFAHESSGSPMKVISVAINTIERRAQRFLKDQYEAVLKMPVSSIKRAIESLGVLSSATLRLVDHDKRRVGRVDVHDVINEVVQTFLPFFEGRQVQCVVDLCAGDPYLRASPAAIESILTNFINNSLRAFEVAGTRSRQILIRTTIVQLELTLACLDTGPGITDIPLADIWLPGETTRENGTGLGLAIVHDAVQDLGGSVGAIANGELGGAELFVHLPILGV
jgi:signal transduction histidine kinase